MTPATTTAAPLAEGGRRTEVSGNTRHKVHPPIYAPRTEQRRMTSPKYDTTLLADDLIRSLVAVERLTPTLHLMLTHIDAAFPGCIEAVQHSMRPTGSQGNGGVHTSDVSDRTFAEVARRSRGHDRLVEIAALAAEVTGVLRQLERLVTSQRREADAYELEQVRKAARCNGDPTCQENALKDGLCGPCAARKAAGMTWTSSRGAVRGADGRTGARPKWDALMAASADNLRAGLEQVIREAS